jgi:hypothetical protein
LQPGALNRDSAPASGVAHCVKEKVEMTVSAKAVRFDDNSMWVDLSDGRTIGVPYA